MRCASVSLTLGLNQMMKEFANVMLKITLFGMGKIASVMLIKDSLMTDKVAVNVQKIHLSLILLRAAKAVMKERLSIYLF